MLLPTLVVLVALQGVLAAVPAAQNDRLSDRQVLAAINLGMTGRPQPRHLLQEGDSHLVAAVAYSPAVRIAMAARQAHERGVSFTIADVPVAWRERVVYVAMRSLPKSADPPVSLHDKESRVFFGRSWSGRSERVEALWVSHDPRSVLGEFGAKLAYPDIAVVAWIPMSARESC